MSDLQQDPARLFRTLLQSFKEAASDMGKASSQSQWLAFLGPQAGKTIVGAITIALERAFKIKGNEFLEAAGRSRGMPIKNHVSARWIRQGRPSASFFRPSATPRPPSAFSPKPWEVRTIRTLGSSTPTRTPLTRPPSRNSKPRAL